MQFSAKSRDQFDNFTSRPGYRKIATDFNHSGSDKLVKGSEIAVPDDLQEYEIEPCKEYVSELYRFFSLHGIEMRMRPYDYDKDGLPDGLRQAGYPGVIHTEPFFAKHREARLLIQQYPDVYCHILMSTLGQIPGAHFILPHTVRAQGAYIDELGLSEREFAAVYIMPRLQQMDLYRREHIDPEVKFA
jgi:hypothetical protein